MWAGPILSVHFRAFRTRLLVWSGFLEMRQDLSLRRCMGRPGSRAAGNRPRFLKGAGTTQDPVKGQDIASTRALYPSSSQSAGQGEGPSTPNPGLGMWNASAHTFEFPPSDAPALHLLFLQPGAWMDPVQHPRQKRAGPGSGAQPRPLPLQPSAEYASATPSPPLTPSGGELGLPKLPTRCPLGEGG